MSGVKKQYGLIIPSKVKEAALNFRTRSLNPLIDSGDELEKDEEQEDTLDWVQQTLKKSAGNSGMQSLQKRRIKEAFEEDSTIFQYDEVYDEIKESSRENQKKQVTKKPKYIDTILKHTEKRKLENERRQERKVQKEREAEGNQYEDKESFVTASYLKKLEEIKKADEEERKERCMEDAVDVHKHKNFGVFYNHLLNQRVGETPDGDSKEKTLDIKQEPIDEESEQSSEEDSDKKVDQETSRRSTTFPKNRDSRQKIYRSRRDESESPDRNKSNSKRTKTSDSEEDESSKDRHYDLTSKKSKEKHHKKEGKETSHKKEEKSSSSKSKKDKKSGEKNSEESQDEIKSEEKIKKKSVKDMPLEERIVHYEVTFAVKTTGQIFKDALQRYFERKANKLLST